MSEMYDDDYYAQDDEGFKPFPYPYPYPYPYP